MIRAVALEIKRAALLIGPSAVSFWAPLHAAAAAMLIPGCLSLLRGYRPWPGSPLPAGTTEPPPSLPACVIAAWSGNLGRGRSRRCRHRGSRLRSRR